MVNFVGRLSKLHPITSAAGVIMTAGDVAARARNPADPAGWITSFRTVDPYATAITNPLMTGAAITSAATAIRAARAGDAGTAAWRTAAALSWAGAELVTLIWNEPLNARLRRIDVTTSSPEERRDLQRRWNAVSDVREVLLWIATVTTFLRTRRPGSLQPRAQ